MPVVILIAIVAVLVGVFFAATGRGGELAYEHVDHAPLGLGPVSAPDVALLRPPTAMWGYNMQVTDEALDQIARAMRDRDVTIAYLQERLANRDAEEPATAQVRLPADALDALEALRTAGDPAPAPLSRSSQAPGTLVAPLPPRATPPPEVAQPSEGAQPWEVTEPPEATQPSDVTEPLEVGQPTDVAEPLEATRASEPLPAPDEAHGPQGSFDTHGWWSQQEEASREEEARRLAAAQEAAQVPPADAGDSEPGASSFHPDPPEDDSATEEQPW